MGDHKSSQLLRSKRQPTLIRSYYFRTTSLGLILLSVLFIIGSSSTANPFFLRRVHTPPDASEIIARCRQISLQPEPPEHFHQRSASDRLEAGTLPVLIQNAKLWTGRNNGTEVIKGDILLDKGIIQSVGHLRRSSLQAYGKDLVVMDAKGAWITPGIVDVHSHLGVDPSPVLEGSSDSNSLKGIVQPWLRSLDALNTHDDAYPLSIAGGVTTSLILPGSANAIGGQAFVIKLRETSEKSSSSMVLEPPYQINTSFPNLNLPLRWRYIKHACGENPSGVYDGTRMDTSWAFRQAYNTAKQIKEQQDTYCSRALSNDWENLGEFPEVLEWEALVDVLRGRVKVNTHCYEAVDIDGFVRLSNEFKFPIAAFHHAAEAYLVPDLIKGAYGKPPAIALFAAFGRYKREAYRVSVFAPRILAEHGLTVLMKSDHPGINSRYLLYEAQQAFFYGLPENLALLSVTSNAAEILGMGHRIGYLEKGKFPRYDADLVLWDSHPLALGATPSQVFIDGIPQLESPHVVEKPGTFQKSPKVPNFDEEARQAVKYEGLPPLSPKKASLDTTVIFTNVKSIHHVKNKSVEEIQTFAEGAGTTTVVTRNGLIICHGIGEKCTGSGSMNLKDTTVKTVDLEGGSISPGLVSFGYPLGLVNMRLEPSTNDGSVYDPLLQTVPSVLGGSSSIVRAIDGLQYGTRNALLGYCFGVTIGVTAPLHEGFLGGLATAFSLGASHKLEEGAVIQEVTSVHVSVGHSSKPSVSTQIAALRRLLLGKIEGEAGFWFKEVAKGKIPLVVEADSADIIATLLILKEEVEAQIDNTMRLTIYGGAEAHLVAKELGEQNVGVILSRMRPFPGTWDQRRIIPGPPISKNNTVIELLANNVTIGIGCDDFFCAVQNLPFDIAWAAIESGGRLSKAQALALGSTNILKLLGVEYDAKIFDLVATKGGDLLDMSHKVAAILSPRQSSVHLFE